MLIKKQYNIGIIAPSSPVSPQEFKQIKNYLNNNFGDDSHIQYKLFYDQDKVTSNINAAEINYDFLSAGKSNRLKQITDALEDDDIDIIWPIKGGVGCSELINDLYNYQIKSNKDKILMGFSDITILHYLFYQKYNLKTIHSNNISNIVRNSVGNKEADELVNIFNKTTKNNINLSIEQLNIKKNIILSEHIIGGNLSIITSLIGTKLHPKHKNHILFLEDIDEEPYKIWRMLHHLNNANLFDGVNNIIFGQFTYSDPKSEFHNKTDPKILSVIKKFIAEYLNDKNIFFTDEIGHIINNQYIMIGAKYNIDYNINKKTASLKLLR